MSDKNKMDKGASAAASAKSTVKRRRVATDRFGTSSDSVNKDGYFDDNGGDLSDGDPDENSSHSLDNHLGPPNGYSPSKDVIEIGSDSRKQVSRMEAKLDSVIEIMHKIQRTIISLSINSANPDAGDVDDQFFRMFPLTTKESMDRLEENLNDNVFRRNVVEHLCTINGVNGIKKGGKIARSVVYGTICPSIAQDFTWTGNSIHNQPGDKIGFGEKFRNLFSVFFSVIHAYDKSYTKSDCEDDLKNRIFKHAKSKAQNQGKKSEPSPSTVLVNLTLPSHQNSTPQQQHHYQPPPTQPPPTQPPLTQPPQQLPPPAAQYNAYQNPPTQNYAFGPPQNYAFGPPQNYAQYN